jgi:hypothetical protein
MVFNIFSNLTTFVPSNSEIGKNEFIEKYKHL